MKTGDNIKVHMYDSNNKEITTRNGNKVFTVCEKDGKTGIEWIKNEFAPFETFAQSVIFENVETGERFHFNNIKNVIEKVSECE